MIADVICKADTSNEIYFLLTSYIEAMQFSGVPSGIAPDILHLPLQGRIDVKRRFGKLLVELDGASRRLDDQSCLAIREALHVFGAALNRLRTIDNETPRLLISDNPAADISCNR